MQSTSHSSTGQPPEISNNNNDGPKRFIFTMHDMNQFINSPAKRDLLSFVTSLGRSTTSSSSYTYNHDNPLIGLGPGMASLHGSLNAIASNWLKDLPPDVNAKARFGNPVFKQWHERLVKRSFAIIKSMMDCHVKYVVASLDDSIQNENENSTCSSSTKLWDMSVLEECSNAGKEAALVDHELNSTTGEKQTKVITELQAYLHQSFGHEIRLDYGTGHECSFYIFLYALCKIGIFGNIPKSTTPSSDIMAPVALSITSQYLHICRGIQTDYMLEPAGSHGVWGLDDYHCIPFYIGACQLQHPYYAEHNGSSIECRSPSCIHNNSSLASEEGQSILYFTCIRYIKELKKNVPFFESSPMLNDISQLPNWTKVSGGLLRLFDGEVLNKKPVVQHFVFGDLFKGEFLNFVLGYHCAYIQYILCISTYEKRNHGLISILTTLLFFYLFSL